MLAYSGRFDLIFADVRKVLIGAGVAGLGALLTYLLEGLMQIDFGSYTAVIVAVLSVLVNVVRKYVVTTKYR
ncbi:hypothetical protein LCGC14_2218930, partial [marine sediment metagenome]